MEDIRDELKRLYNSQQVNAETIALLKDISKEYLDRIREIELQLLKESNLNG